jgi:hypothetical protein
MVENKSYITIRQSQLRALLFKESTPQGVKNECRVQSVEYRVQSVECRVQSVECRVQSVECRVQCTECRVQSAVYRV